MKLRKASGHEMLTLTTVDSYSVHAMQWFHVSFVWYSYIHTLVLLIDGREIVRKAANLKEGELPDLYSSSGRWTIGKEDDAERGNLQADVKNFFVSGLCLFL